MSEENSDVWDLTLRIQGLSIRLSGTNLRGSSSQAQQGAESGASGLSSAFSIVPEPTPSPNTPVSEPAQAAAAPVTPPRQSSAASVPEYPSLGSSRSPGFEARQRLVLSFPAIPDTCVALCRSLTVCELGPAGRAERAWVAGCWAGAVLISQQNRFYCILRASDLQAPVVCASVSAYRRILGLDLGRSVSHAFPSTSECRVYFSAAQVPYPAHLTR